MKMTNEKIIEWLFNQFKRDGVNMKYVYFEDYVTDEQTIQFFRKHGLTKESYNKYCVEILCYDGLDESSRMLINDLCYWR